MQEAEDKRPLMDDPAAFEEFAGQLLDSEQYLTLDRLRAAFGMMWARYNETQDELTHYQGSYGTPLEYDPAYAALCDENDMYYLACMGLRNLFDRL